jgi:Protein of unknown function (DUF3987)/Bifunctional DNA primase/polymerase, N-terminal
MTLQNDDPFAASPPLPHEQLRAVVTARRIAYLKAGYEPIPVLSGRKRPVLDGWRDIKLDINTVSAWADRPGELSTGIRTQYTPGFDIDIRDQHVADQVERALLNMIPQQGTILKRIGLPPKRLIPFRCETPFKKIITTFKSPDDVVHKVEVLADGQQFVAEGIHETTHQPYRWADNVNLLSVAHEHLPLVGEALARRFVTEASEIMRRAGWIEVDAQGKLKTNGKRKINGKTSNKSEADSIYYRSALKDECAALASAPKGGRNDALNRAAFNLFQLVTGGGLDEETVQERLYAAAEACGLVNDDGEASVRATIESGAKAGRAQPRRAPNGGVRAHNQHSGSEALHTWETPDWSILDDRRGELPDFPLDCLGAPVREWVERAARGAGVTPAHVAVPALGIASSLIGMARRVKATSSWIYPMTCWAAIVGESGTGKTPGIDTIKRAMDQVERNNRNKVAELRRQHETKAEAAKAARAQWKKQVEEAVAAGQAGPQMPEAATDPGKFIAPRPYVSNSTIERLGELLQARPQGVVLLMDELAALFMNMSRYSGGEDNQFWLEAWNGGSSIVERMNRSLQIDHLLVGVVGGIQPDKLARSFEHDQDGMYARFLFAWPPKPAYRRLTDETKEFDPDIINIITRLDRLAEFEDGNLVPREIKLPAEAMEEFERLRQWADREQEALDGREREWMAKAQAHALRLSGTLCLLDWAARGGAEPAEIGADYMRASIRLVQVYFWPHARAALRQIGLSERHVNARRALRWIKARRRPEQDISIEGIRVDALGRRFDAEGTIDLLGAMTRSGWVREKKDEDGPRGRGRPARRWEANPLLWSPEIPEIPENPYPAAAIEPNPTPQGISGISGISGKHNDMAAATGAVNGSDDNGRPEFRTNLTGTEHTTLQECKGGDPLEAPTAPLQDAHPSSLQGDRNREAVRARNREALQRFEQQQRQRR